MGLAEGERTFEGERAGVSRRGYLLGVRERERWLDLDGVLGGGRLLGVDVCEALGLLGVREGERGLDREGVLGVGRLLGVDLCEELGLLGGGGGGREAE